MSTPSAATTAPIAGTESMRVRLTGLLLRPSTVTFIILVVIVAVFATLAPVSFASVDNARAILTDASILLVLSVAINFPMITAGIDLSTGSVLVFSGVLSVKAMQAVGGNGPGVAVLGGVVAVGSGLAWGALHGVLVAYGRIPAFIATLGTLGAALGLSYIITGGFDLQDVPSSVTSIASQRLLGVPWLVVAAAVVAVVFGVLLQATRFGRYTYAIGASEEAARRASINVNVHLVKVYVIAGGLTGLAGFLSLARFATTTLAGHATDNLQAVTAVVLGGTSLFGGTGAVVGTVAGVFIPTVLQNGFVVTGVTPYWQQVAVGVVLIAAVYLDKIRRSRSV
ncbi:ABC transporter permease [Microbispora sp. NPDC088329]|uniref:ABC transporter permease n=1 Tax=Microbispora sp. NPDC088329 TaxID=3154869 RepID=UPI0034149571